MFAKVRLFCFPHAGGSASFYYSWSNIISQDIELVAVQLPGREDRILDPFKNTSEEVIAEMSKEFKFYKDKPYYV